MNTATHKEAQIDGEKRENEERVKKIGGVR
jgi:hypothetical protein